MLYFVPIMQVLILTPFMIFVIVILIKLIWEICWFQNVQKSLLSSSAEYGHAPQPIQPVATYGTIDNKCWVCMDTCSGYSNLEISRFVLLQ